MGDEEFSVKNVKGVGPVLAQRLEAAGISTMYELQTRGAPEIQQITQADKDYAARIIENARAMLHDAGRVASMFASGTEMVERSEGVERISTGSKNLDDMFRGSLPEGKGGVETGALTEVYGEFGSGKTQFCLKMAVMGQLPKERGGLDTDVIFMDCEEIYRYVTERINAMAKSVGLDAKSVHDRMTVVTPPNSDAQISTLDKIEEMVREGVRLVIVDGSMSHFRADYGIKGREGFPARASAITKFINRLKHIAALHNAAVVISNQVRPNPDAFGDDIQPYGGSILAHTSTYRVYFNKVSSRTSKSRVSMQDSPRHDKRDFEVWLTHTGPADAPPGRGKKYDPKLDGDPDPPKKEKEK